MTSDENDFRSSVARLISNAGEVAGTAFGAIAGVSTGDPVLVVSAAVIGSIFGKSASEVATRALSARQEHRAGRLVVEALGAVKAKEVMGETYRSDGFFDGDRSDGDELIEGVLHAAMDAYEERKLPYLANLIANVCFDPTIDAASANYALRMLEHLSWPEMEMLGIFWAAEETKRFTMPDSPKDDRLGSWREATVHQIYIDLNDRHKLIYHLRVPTPVGRVPMFDMNLSAVRLTNGGKLIAGLAELNTIPQQDLEPIYAVLVRPGDEPG